MSSRARLWPTWILPVVVAACGAGSPPEPPIPTATIAQVARDCASEAAGCEGPRAAAPAVTLSSVCVDGEPGLRCEGLVGAEEAKGLPAAIEAAHQAVLASAFSDVHAMVRLARLHLRRDADVADSDGPTDAVRGLRSAMRAVAVDDGSAEARLALAVGIARSLQAARASTDPTVRGLALDLVDLAVHAVPAAPGVVGAAARTLEGYVALERGQPAPAKAAFEEATRLDPDLRTAWVGLGDVGRLSGDFAAATAAYERAEAIRPNDPGVVGALRAAARREALRIPVASAAPPRPSITPGPLAPAPPALPWCPARPAATAPGAALCDGLAGLAVASSRADHEQAALRIVEGWRDMLPLCEARDPACGPHVVEALAAASRAFQKAGQTAKSIASARIVLDHERFPGAAALAPAVALEIGDRYFSLGIFVEAANWYERHLREVRINTGPVADRLRALRAVLAVEEGPTRPRGEGTPPLCPAPLSCALKRLTGERW